MVTASQIFQGVARQPDPTRHSSAVLPPTTVWQATQNLVSIVHMLRSSESGWPVDKPQTPETLLPYVSDEAEELLETLHQWNPSPQVASTESAAAAQAAASLTTVTEIAAQLVWSIAASAPIAMQLMEGMPAQVPLNRESTSSSQGVRLVPVLILHWNGARYALDLITQTPFEEDIQLADDRSLGLGDSPISEATQAITDWRDWLWRQAIAHTPELAEWRQGRSLELLIPEHSWCEATATLMLHLVALSEATVTTTVETLSSQQEPDLCPEQVSEGSPAAPRVWVSTASAIAESATAAPPPEMKPFAAARDYPALTTEIIFNDAGWLQTAIAAAYSPAVLSQLSPSNAPDRSTLDALAVTRTVFQVLPSAEFATGMGEIRSPMSLAALQTHIQWQWLRSHRALMALMAGVSANQLSPGKEWQTGVLVATGQLTFETGGTPIACLDVNSGQWHDPTAHLPETDIVQLPTLDALPHALWRVSDLRSHLSQHLRARSASLSHWMDGTSVRLHPAPEFSAGWATETHLTLRLQIVLAFYG